jgi:type IV pilus assembly protein PilC
MADLQLFQWTGINSEGKRTSGQVHAADISNAQAELKKKRIEVITLEVKTGFTTTKSKHKLKKIKSRNIMFFTKHLSTMIASGLPIMQSLDIISHDKENPSMQTLISSIKNNTSEGKTLAESFSEYPEYFSELYCNLVKSGEKSGTLDKTLARLSNYLEKTENLKRKIKKALIYPSAIIFVAFGVSLILLFFVVPQFQAMFKSFGAELPLFTRMIVNLSNFLREYWWLIGISIFIFIWGLRYAIRQSEDFRFSLDKWSLKIYVIGNVIEKGIVARFARTLATTLEAGVPMVDSMKPLAQIMGNRVYSKAVLKICDDVISGHQLSESMISTHLFPHVAVQMVSVGEASGKLSEMLHHVADYYEEEVDTIVENLSSLLEPLIMVVIGVIVGSFVIAMYLPIFKLGSLF